MFSKTPEIYDLIYSQFKSYEEESGKIAKLISTRCRNAKTVLDVACGTGEHARCLAKLGYCVSGVDLEPEFVRIAARKNPNGRFFTSDMRSFDTGEKYDVVMCLFSSIAYVLTLNEIVRALNCFKEHLAPGGLIVVEPWMTPDNWTAGKVYMKTASTPTLSACRISHSTIEGNVSVLRFEYLIGTAEGIRHEVEIHKLGLFSVEQMKEAFHLAELECEYDPVGIFDRGLYLARAAERRSSS